MPTGYTNSDILEEKKKYLVTDNLKLVDHVIQKSLHISANDPYYDDYQSEGRLALVKAAVAFDESKGVKFSTYACLYISGYVRRLRREFTHSLVRTPRSVMDNFVHVMQLSEQGLSYEEIEEELGISKDEIQEALNSYGTISLDQPLSDIDNPSDNLTYDDVLGYWDTEFDVVDEDDRALKAVEAVASKLSERDRNIWYEYIYPLYFEDNVTEREIADKYGISRSYVSRLILKFKKMFAQELGYPESSLQGYGKERK